MNRGSPGIHPTLHSPTVCFNEAPIHESGKLASLSVMLGSSARFNEAPIHESGKFCKARSSEWRRNCFNEAPIHESGKFL